MWVDERSIAVEFTFVEVAFIDHAVWEDELSLAFLPVVSFRPLILTT